MAKAKNLLAGRKTAKELGSNGKVPSGKKKAELLALQTQHTKEAQNAVTVDEAQAEIDTVITDLMVMVQQLRDAGTHNRFQYSPHRQREMLLSEIRERVKIKALRQNEMGIDEESNMSMCQEFVDKVRVGMGQAGVHLNLLYVIKPRR